MKKFFRNERGFMLFNVIFLLMITASVATILINAFPRMNSPQAVLRLTAIHLANEQFAILESLAAQGDDLTGKTSFQGNRDDLKSINYVNNALIEFEVTTTLTGSGNLRGVKVIVSWEFEGKTYDLELERTIRIVEPAAENS